MSMLFNVVCQNVTVLIKKTHASYHPTIRLPHFCAPNISRLPPVDADHVDISVVLQELSLLRQEVRMISQLRAELEFKANQQSLYTVNYYRCDHIRRLAFLLHRQRDEFPPLVAASSIDESDLSEKYYQ